MSVEAHAFPLLIKEPSGSAEPLQMLHPATPHLYAALVGFGTVEMVVWSATDQIAFRFYCT